MDKHPLSTARGIAVGVSLGILAWAAIFGSSRALSQEAPRRQCGPFAQMRESLKAKYGEIEIGGGIVNEQTVLIIFASPDGATWTVVAMGVDGNACLMSMGENWFQTRIPAPGERPA